MEHYLQNLENLVLVSKTSIFISEKLSYNEKVSFLKKYDINYDHYRDGCCGYYDKTIGWGHLYSKCKVYNGELLSTVLLKLMQTFTEKFNKVYPHIACCVHYDDMFNKIKENSNYYHGGYHVNEKFAEYFKGHYTKFASYYFAMDIEEENIKVINKAIRKISKLKPDKISPELGMIYIATRNFHVSRFCIKEGTKFNLIRKGSGWNYHSLLNIIEGEVATTIHSDYFNTTEVTLNDVNGNVELFYTLAKFEEIFGVSLSKLEVGYDPYNGDYLPCVEYKDTDAKPSGE